CSTDLDAFEAALARNDFATAATLWRGEYAADLDFDVEAWAAWRDAVRARLRPSALAAFEATARAAATDDAQLSAAARMLSLDPLNEVAIGMMLPVVARSQGAAAAAAIYDDFAARLRRARDRSPSPDTAAIYASALGAAAAASPGRYRFAPTKAAAACALLAIAGLFGAAAFQFGRIEEPATAGTFVESAILRWPFRFAVGEPRALDREPSTLRVSETLAQDLRNALAVMPGSALAATTAQTDFMLESDIRSGPDDRLAINLRLVERASGRVIWADSVPGPERYAGGFPERQAASV
ncbi:BTAD domain-containing putative transcriptional regulator, partial [Nostoc sp. NIES-2111]